MIRFPRLALAAPALAILPFLAAPAAADNNDWDDGPHCQIAANTTRLDSAKAIGIGESLGYRIVSYEIDDGCIELDGIDGQGAKITLRLDPVTGSVIPYHHP
jgi:hypothetical protein